MVNMKFLAFTPLLAAPLAAALPTTSTGNTMASRSDSVPFSFEQWADAIAKGEPHLSVEEAVQAADAANSGPNGNVERSLEKRLRCNHLDLGSAWAPDAVACINQLASNGQTCRVDVTVAFCTIGNAQIVGVRGGPGPYTESSCQDVARAAGYVMDNCWRADNTVQGDHYAWGNGNMAVHIAAPSI
ncbi:hypothetical protein B0T11DRAFT_344715 [Plectosphaerella cucumerina]|uniref:Uncharacterized protein n=1 Tax=Plectosphaerella cucumerina TaxID=40658 RepID=A0A8K0X8S5_9PEZI|nr:hypothetical protein B0T11DRAFT_344715 [Plectosphaerella cucumerina]